MDSGRQRQRGHFPVQRGNRARFGKISCLRCKWRDWLFKWFDRRQQTRRPCQYGSYLRNGGKVEMTTIDSLAQRGRRGIRKDIEGIPGTLGRLESNGALTVPV